MSFDQASTLVRQSIASTNVAIMKGLMGKERIEENEGMLFIFKMEEERFFWMKNTSIPLDILFIDSKFNVISIVKSTTPFSEDLLSSIYPAKCVLEVNSGYTTNNNIKIGSSIKRKKSS